MPPRLTGSAWVRFMCFRVCISTVGKRPRCGTFLCEFVWCSDDAPVVAHQAAERSGAAWCLYEYALILAPFRSAALRGSAQGGIGGCATVGCARPCRARLPTAMVLRRCRGLSVDVESLYKTLCCSRQRAVLAHGYSPPPLSRLACRFRKPVQDAVLFTAMGYACPRL